MTVKLLSKKQVQAHSDEIARNGYSIIENAIKPDFLKEIIEEIGRLESVRPGGDIPPGPFSGLVTKRWFDVLNDGEVWQRVATHPWILSVMQSVLGDCLLYTSPSPRDLSTSRMPSSA